MVLKSNKFDFSNRGSSGTKLGQIVGDAFVKELEKAKKDAMRQANKLAKSGNEGGKDISVHIIDCKVPNKNLGDAGLQLMASGMMTALRSGTVDASLVIQHLNLKGNGLTAHGLKCFMPKVFLGGNLRTLNLSDNAIKVETDAEASSWHIFLLAVALSRERIYIDLSGNEELGSRGWEIFARVFAIDGSADVVKPPVRTPTYRETFDDPPENEAPPSPKRPKFTALSRAASIPYLNIANTNLNNAGALWLSYFATVDVITCTSEQIITAPGYGEAQDLVDWTATGSALGKDGLQLLKWTEDGQLAKLNHGLLPVLTVSPHEKTRRVSGRHAPGAAVDKGDVIALRHKIQRLVIQNLGIQHVHLWHSALQTMTITRRLLIILANRAVETRSSHLRAEADPGLYSTVLSAKTISPKKDMSPRIIRIVDPGLAKRVTTVKKPKLTDKSNRATSRSVSKAKFGTSDSAITVDLGSLSLASCMFTKYREYQEARLVKKPYCDNTLPCRLPASVFRKIVYNTKVTLCHRLSETQMELAYRWGQDRKTLGTEREWMKLAESAQVLNLLERVKCLSYVE